MNPLFESIRRGATPDVQTLVRALAPDLPLLEELAQTPQEPAWHGEGDVYIHTGMVLEALYPTLTSSSPDERLVLVLGALLHDIAKPLTTHPVEIQGIPRIAAQGHEARGRSYLVPRCLGWGLPYPLVEQVLGLVGDHLLPKLLVKREKGPGSYRQVGRRVDPRLLTLLECADMRGRICADREEAVEAVELFGLYAEEYEAVGWEMAWRRFFEEAFGGLTASAQDWAFGEAIRAAEAEKIRVPEEALYLGHAVPAALPELVVMVGPSGSGKSSFIKKYLGDHTVVSLDALREELAADRADQSQNGKVRQAAKERLKAALRAGEKVVWDATSLRKDFRMQVAGLGFDYRALVTFVVVHPTLDSLAHRNRSREHEVPARVLEQQLAMLEWPECGEAHRRIVVDGSGQVLSMQGRCAPGLPYGLLPSTGSTDQREGRRSRPG